MAYSYLLIFAASIAGSFVGEYLHVTKKAASERSSTDSVLAAWPPQIHNTPSRRAMPAEPSFNVPQICFNDKHFVVNFLW